MSVGQEVLVFRVGGERFAIAVGVVEAIAELPAIQALPAMPPNMLGVCELRGSLVPVYTPSPVLRAELREPAGIIVAWAGGRGVGVGRRVAIAISQADGVIAFDPQAWRGVGGGAARDGIVLGVATYGQAVTTLLDAESFLAACAGGSGSVAEGA